VSELSPYFNSYKKLLKSIFCFISAEYYFRYITNRMREKEDEEEVVADWKFAAMVIDRSA
jgi:hypothetical protein